MKRWSYMQVSPMAINGAQILEELQELERQEYDNGTAIKHDLTSTNIH